jgi:hypothetical protein
MANNLPFDQLSGPLDIYVGAVGATVPAVNATPSAAWTLVGATDGGQKLKIAGSNTYFRDDDHTGPVKAVRPEEDVIMTTTVVGLTVENMARILTTVANIASAVGPPATKTYGLRRGYYPSEYAMLLKGSVASPYGALPGMYVIPRGVFDGEPELAYTKDERAGAEIEFHALEDDTQSTDDKKLGWLVVQTS